MAYQSLYRRYRPQRFAEIRGQQHLVAALRNAVRDGRVGHAYLFSGPRGTGKTTTARILAKALNCPNVTDGEPDGTCESCVAIQNGTSFDVHELDAASNNKVEDIRDLISKAALGTPGRTKVYILDEVHMLTPAASNALLKTLEEPPEHVVFVLATTDPQKVLPTIRSRTQHFEVHLLTADELTELAEFIIADAGLDVPEGTVPYVVAAGNGSARDMESALDQVVAAGGLPDDGDALAEIIEALCARDTGQALLAVDRAVQNGRAPRTLGEELMGRLRDVFLASMHADLGRLPDQDQARVADQAQRLGTRGATRALELLGEAFVGIQDAPDPRITLEIALVRLTKPEVDTSLSSLLERIERLERGAGPIAPVTAAPVAAPAPADEPSAAAATESVDESTGRPADAARQALARKSSTPAPTPAKPAPRSRPPKAAAAPTPAPAPAAPAPTSTSTATAVATGELPTRDALTLAWGDTVFGSLPQKAKVRFGAGRWLDVDDAAVFALPNAIHQSRCEDCRGDVEAALAAHFGHPVPVRLVVDDAPPEPRGSSRPEPNPAEDEAELAEQIDSIDLDDLTDAPDADRTGIDRITELFPGAELVEED
jgi:DNA polymerase-3 subunit gamma/tau